MNFQDLGLDAQLLKAVEHLGYVQPTEIQQKAIPYLLSDNAKDLVGLAQTGTGKTAAFGLPLLHQIDGNAHYPQALILSPTRELGLQIAKELGNFAQFMKDIRIVSVYGGASIDDQIREIKKGCQIIVATPGRLIDLLERKKIDLTKISHLVLDEADEMLNMGFKEDLDTILEHASSERKTWLFSATMPAEVKRIAKNYMDQPHEIVIGKQNSGNTNIEHQYILVRPHDRYPALKRVLDFYPEIFGLIFCRTRTETKEVADKLMQEGYSAEALHGDLSQAQRDAVMKKFRQKNIQILVATDVAARGIDINDITHVVHYVLPDDIEVYTHRSGRTGRAGKKGISVAIIATREEKRVRDIEFQIKQKLVQIPVPKGMDIVQKQMRYLVEKIKEAQVTEQMNEQPFLDELYQEFEAMEKTEIVQKFMAAEFHRFFNYYAGIKDLVFESARGSRERGDRFEKRDRADRGERGDRFGSDRSRAGKVVKNGRVRFFVNLGMEDQMNKGGLLRWVCDEAHIPSTKVGQISMMREFAFFEIDAESSEQVYAALHHAQYEGKKVRVQYAKERETSSRF